MRTVKIRESTPDQLRVTDLCCGIRRLLAAKFAIRCAAPRSSDFCRRGRVIRAGVVGRRASTGAPGNENRPDYYSAGGLNDYLQKVSLSVQAGQDRTSGVPDTIAVESSRAESTIP